jgi:hypothetical protein
MEGNDYVSSVVVVVLKKLAYIIVLYIIIMLYIYQQKFVMMHAILLFLPSANDANYSWIRSLFVHYCIIIIYLSTEIRHDAFLPLVLAECQRFELFLDFRSLFVVVACLPPFCGSNNNMKGLTTTNETRFILSKEDASLA